MDLLESIEGNSADMSTQNTTYGLHAQFRLLQCVLNDKPDFFLYSNTDSPCQCLSQTASRATLSLALWATDAQARRHASAAHGAGAHRAAPLAVSKLACSSPSTLFT